MRKVDPVKHEKKRREILQAAERCFAREGFRGSTIADICKEAKVSAGHLYHYFAGKESIVSAMAEVGLEYAAQQFSLMLSSSSALDMLTAQFERTDAEHRARRLVILDAIVEAGRNPAMEEVIRRHSQVVLNMLADFLREAQKRGQVDPSLDPEMAAAIIQTLLDGSVMLTIRFPALDTAKSVKLLKTLISRFLAPPTSAAAPASKNRQKSRSRKRREAR